MAASSARHARCLSACAFKGKCSISEPSNKRSPDLAAPPGVPIGAVDPVTGLSSLISQLGELEIEYKRT